VGSLGNPDNPSIYLNPSDLSITKDAVRLTSPTTYTITVAAYDTSGNTSAPSAPVSGDPPPGSDERDCAAGTVSDTTVNPLPPSPPESLTAAPGAERELVVSWVPPADGSATVGFRLYRSDTEFPDNAPIAAALLIADESTLGPGVTSYTDPGLVGCQTYYYAVASINCDETLAANYLYDTAPGQGNFAKANGDPEDFTPPPATSLAGTKAGWQRIFLDFVNPLPEEEEDFNRTEIHFNPGASCPTLQPGGNVSGGSPIPDNDSGIPGTFVGPGSKTVIFDDHTLPLPPPPGDPTLNSHGEYCLLSVAYDDCENTASDSSSLVLVALCGDDPPGPPPEWPVNPTYTSCFPERVKLTWEYPPKEYTGTDQLYDFAGYRLWRSGPQTETEIELTDGPTWSETWTDSNDLREGGRYRYTVRATDCVYENDPANFPNNYSTALSIPSDSGWISPGKLSFYEGDPMNALAVENFVTAHSDENAPFTHHNNVRFFLQNTSAAAAVIESMAVEWANPNVVLASITVGGPPSITSVTVIPTGGVPGGTQVSMNVNVNDTATGLGQPSVPVPVVLRFTNSDGSVNRFTDMRSQRLLVALAARNTSLQQSSCDAEVFEIDVPQGPLVGNFIQDWPAPFGSPCYEVVGRSGSARDDDLKVPALVEVNVQGLVYDTTGQLDGGTALGFDTLSLFTASGPVTPIGDEPAMPTGVSYTELPLQQISGNQFAIFDPYQVAGAKLPIVSGGVAWYYLLAVDRTGNFDRFPNADFGACAYYQKPGDACSARPKPPSLSGTASASSIDLSWSPPAENVDGSPVDVATSFLYDLHLSLDGGGFTLLAGDLPGQAYTYTGDIAAASHALRVTAKNNCSSGALESDPSNVFRECEGESGIDCSSFSAPPLVGLEQPFTIAARSICAYALNGVSDTVIFRVNGSQETKDFTVTETGDTGNFTKTVIPTDCKDKDRRSSLAADISATDSIIPLSSASCIPPYGTASLGSEDITYSAVSGNFLTGVVRGANGTNPSSANRSQKITWIGGGPDSYITAVQAEVLTVELIAGSTVSCTETVTLNDPCGDIPAAPSPFSVQRSEGNSQATLTWGVPLYNTDGTRALDLGGYNIEIQKCTIPDGTGCNSWSPWEGIDLPDPNLDTFTVTGLQSASTAFRMRAYDTCATDRKFSAYTDFVRK
jgi:hypothetical protein